MSLNDRAGSGDVNNLENGTGWRRVAFPVPPVSKLVRGSGITSRLGTCAGSGLASWVATGHTQGDVTWATVILALAVIAADVVRARGCTCSSRQGCN